jgi:two-component system CheB/CheR fusion protein
VAVVLSGADGDGAHGLEDITAARGVTLAQEQASAKFSGMPKAAIATGCVDFVLPPKLLVSEILRIVRHPYLSANGSAQLPDDEDHLKRIFRSLREQNGTDFSRYKRSSM